jgi:hypothetical protein
MTNKYSILDRLPHTALKLVRVAFERLRALDEVCGAPERAIHDSMFPFESEVITTRDRLRL